MIRIFLFVLLFILPCWGNAQQIAKKVTINVTNQSIATVLEEITSQTGVEFTYGSDLIPSEKNVTFSVENKAIEDVLRLLFKEEPIEYRIHSRRVVLRPSKSLLVQNLRLAVIEQFTTLPPDTKRIQGIVKAGSKSYTTFANEKNVLEFVNIPVGRISISVLCDGYLPYRADAVLLRTGKELTLEVNVVPLITHMPAVEILAPGMGDSLQHLMMNTSMVSVEEASRYAGSLNDPARMASLLSGVSATSDESNALVVRGNSPRGLLWRVNGIEVPNPNHFGAEVSSSGIISLLSPNIIDYSTFVTGPFSAKYGNALSAVLDLKLRTGNTRKQEHSLQAGTLGMEASTEGPFAEGANASYLINYRYSTLALLQSIGADLGKFDRYSKYQDLAFTFNFPTSSAGTFSCFGIGGLSDAVRESAAEQYDCNSDVFITGLTHRINLGRRSILNTSYSWSGTQIDTQNEAWVSDAQRILVSEEYGKTFHRGSFNITRRFSDYLSVDGGLTYSRIGFDFFLNNLDPTNPTYAQIVNFREHGVSHTFQSYLSAHHRISAQISADYGIHFIRFDLSKDYSVEPRMSLHWMSRHHNVMSLHIGKQSRIENLQYYLARDHQSGGNEVQLNRNLKFTRSENIAVGYKHKLSPFDIKGEVYYQRLYNVPVQADPTTMYATINEEAGFISDTLLNSGRSRNYGVELTVERPLGKSLYYLMTASLYESRFTIGEGKEFNTAYNGNYSVQLAIGKEVELQHGAAIGISLRTGVGGGRPYVPILVEESIDKGVAVYDWVSAFEKRLDDYFRSDLLISFRKDKPRYSYEWRLDVQNVTHHRNAAYYFFDKPSGIVKLKRQVGIIPILTFRINF